ncbi:MAG: hypothetical protein U0324_14695 [Polyangiales bacterium]
MKNLPPLTACALSLGLCACMDDGSPASPDGGVTGLEDCRGDFGTSTASLQIEAFIAAVDSFSTQAAEVDTGLRAECRAIAIDLGAQASELVATASETETAVACRRAAELIRTEMTAVRGAPGVTLTIEAAPPRCEVDVEAYSNCVGSCDATFRPGMAELTCEGGEVRGGCSAECTGRCAVDATATCSGACEGTCAGSCTGSCVGTCDGTCAARDAEGACNGACVGTCRGTCSAGCTGACSGQCVAMASGRCEGECRGSCSASFTRPRCTGRAVAPRADVDCRASCDARVNARTQCTPGQVALRVDGLAAGAPLSGRSDRLRATLAAHYGNVVAAGVRLRALAAAGALVVDSSRRVPAAVASLGLRAATCSTTAAQSVALAVPRVQVSLQASVQVSGAVTAR